MELETQDPEQLTHRMNRYSVARLTRLCYSKFLPFFRFPFADPDLTPGTRIDVALAPGPAPSASTTRASSIVNLSTLISILSQVHSYT